MRVRRELAVDLALVWVEAGSDAYPSTIGKNEWFLYGTLGGVVRTERPGCREKKKGRSLCASPFPFVGG